MIQPALETQRFGEHIPDDVQQALGGLPIRSYTDSDYPHLDRWMESLATFYDGHTPDNKLLDQLVGAETADPCGYFTKSKALVVSTEADGTPTGATCLNFKRGGAVKIGPVVVDAVRRGRGIGSTLFTAADIFAATLGARKLFATTSHLNDPVNRLFDRYGFGVEATFPDQYKIGSEELIWGKFTEGHPNGHREAVQSVVADDSGEVATIEPYSEEDRDYILGVNETYNGWHDDLGEDFIDGMVAGHGRGLDFQKKGKIILVSRTADGDPNGMMTFTPKRGGPVKIYPIAGSYAAQSALLTRAADIAREHGNHKLYTFAHVTDEAQHALLADSGFTQRGTLLSPYKDGHNLVAFDRMVE